MELESAAAEDDSEEARRHPSGGRGAKRDARAERRRPAARNATSVSTSYGERPKPPWHPLPISELLILVGAIAVVIGLRRGLAFGGTPTLVGVLAVSIGTLEVTLREHRSGFRSHSTMLAALPVVIFHSAVVLGISMFTTFPRLANLGLLAIDLALFALIFRMMRSRFLTGRTRAVGRR